MNVTEDNNFCRVFEMPLNYPEGFCFGGGRPVTFLMVDWFNPWPRDLATFELKQATWAEISQELRPWMEKKTYLKPGRVYLLVTDFGESFVFGAKR